MRPDPSKQIAPYLAANRTVAIVDLYTFAPVGGEVIRCSGTVVPMTVPAAMFDTYSLNAGASAPVAFPLGPRFGRSRIAVKVGLQVDAMDLVIYAGPDDLLGSDYTWQQAWYSGVFDLAAVELGRLVCPPLPGGGLGPPVGYVVWFGGLVGETVIGRTTIKTKVNSTLTLLTTQYPRRLWQHTCSHVFGDAMCQFDRQSKAATVQAQAGSNTDVIVTGISPSPSTLYDDGTIIGVSGANAGLKRTVASLVDGRALLTSPFVYPVATNDYFSMLPGCDHTLPTCQNVFNNLAHYGGMPYIPMSEFAI